MCTLNCPHWHVKWVAMGVAMGSSLCSNVCPSYRLSMGLGIFSSLTVSFVQAIYGLGNIQFLDG